MFYTSSEIKIMPRVDNSKTKSTMANEYQKGKDTVKNMFTNDGSFLEMFRKQMQSKQNPKESTNQTETEETSTNVNESASREEKQKTESESTDTTKLNMPIVRNGKNNKYTTDISCIYMYILERVFFFYKTSSQKQYILSRMLVFIL